MAIHVLRRCWQLYIAHIFLFVVFTAQIAYVSSRFNNPMYADEMNLSGFLQEPHIALIEALLLRFRPANMDVLPLYIALLLVFPFVLVAALRLPRALLAVSAAMYVAAPLLGWNLSTYPGDEGWFFNPFTWQLLFVIGTLCACAPQALAPATRWRPWLGAVAAAYLVFALAIVATWYVPALENAVPEWLARVMLPDRQDQPRPPAPAPLRGAGVSRGALRAARCGIPARALGESDSRLRARVALRLLRWYLPVLCRTYRPGGVQRNPARAGHGERRGHRADDRTCLHGRLVRTYRPRAARRGAAGAAAMTRAALAFAVLALMPAAGAVRAQDYAALCQVPPDLATLEDPLPRLARRLGERPLSVIVIGSGSSAGAGTSDRSRAYPQVLQRELERLLGAPVVVDSIAKRGATAADMLDIIRRDVAPRRPALVVWQTGTADAVRGVDIDTFGEALEKGLDALQERGIDMVLMDMQCGRDGFADRAAPVPQLHAVGVARPRRAAVPPPRRDELLVQARRRRSLRHRAR